MEITRLKLNDTYGVKIEVIAELLILFEEMGYNIRHKGQFKAMKRDIFNKVDEPD